MVWAKQLEVLNLAAIERLQAEGPRGETVSDEETLEALARWGVFASRTGLTAGDYDKVANLQAQVAQLTQERDQALGRVRDLQRAWGDLESSMTLKVAEASALRAKVERYEAEDRLYELQSLVVQEFGNDEAARHFPPFSRWWTALTQPQEAPMCPTCHATDRADSLLAFNEVTGVQMFCEDPWHAQPQEASDA